MKGIKAKVNVGDRTLGTSSTSYTQNQLHFLAPQSIVSNTGLLASNTYDLRLPTPPPVGSPYPLANVTTTQSIGNLSTNLTGFSGSAASQFGADVTTYSTGVLSDTRNGGLKRDLTAAFEDTTFQQYNNLLNSCSLGQSDAGLSTHSRSSAIDGGHPAAVEHPGMSSHPAMLDGLEMEVVALLLRPVQTHDGRSRPTTSSASFRSQAVGAPARLTPSNIARESGATLTPST